MISQYLEIKSKNPGTILFFRLGDFYEMFFEDAEIASRVLELTLTSRASGNGERAPMCGVPFHSAESYIAKLVDNGYKVAICEQLEDPKETKGLVKRDIIRTITKGSAIESTILDESKNNYIASVFVSSDGCGAAFADISTGVLNLFNFSGKSSSAEAVNELGVYSPSEILLNDLAASDKKLSSFINKRMNSSCEILDEDYYDYREAFSVCSDSFGREKLEDLGLEENKSGISAIGALLRYLKELYKTDTINISQLNLLSDSQFMKLDYTAKRNLEITESLRTGEKKGSLLWVLDKTRTSMGRRALRSWLNQPLMNPAMITKRQNAVAELVSNSISLSRIQEVMTSMLDIERLTTRIVMQTANAKDLNALKQTVSVLPELKALLSDLKSTLLKQIFSQLDDFEDIYSLIDAAINPDAPFSLHNGDIINNGFNSELDELIDIQTNGKRFLSKIEAEEREKTGIPKLRIGFNKVFGYYIEVTNSYKELVPEHYIRKQTLTNAERYITPELKEHENKVLGSQERSVKLEYELFCQVRDKIGAESARLRTTGRAVAVLDALCSFARSALEYNYTCPTIVDRPVIDITEGRHPVVERVLESTPFVPNDTYLDCGENRTAIITGPNMAGKSTYMRQIALICLMAQTGSFVPAKRASLGIVDSIFTRVGASDDLASGQSTFMVEMSEVSNIIRSATKNSLIILDEVGRGTSTFDGMSIARSCLEYITDKKKIGAKTLFSTHYHELTELENVIEGVKNYNISVKKRGSSITFLRRIVRGKADGSYGLEVAKLAGLPDSVIKRADAILKELESSDGNASFVTGGLTAVDTAREDNNAYSFSSSIDEEIINQLKATDIETITPLEALTLLNEFVKKARSDGRIDY